MGTPETWGGCSEKGSRDRDHCCPVMRPAFVCFCPCFRDPREGRGGVTPPPPESKTGGLTFGRAGPGSQGGSYFGGGGLLLDHSTMLPFSLSRHRKCLSPCF